MPGRKRSGAQVTGTGAPSFSKLQLRVPMSKNDTSIGLAPRRTPQTRLILSLVALILLALPIGIVWRDWQRWAAAPAVTGTVVRISPEGPFPDVVTVEYQDQANHSHQVDISTNYATARKVGDPVDLFYLPDAPERAMTRIQQRDEGWSVSPYLLFGSLALSTFFLYFAFPEYLTLKKRRNF